MRVFVENIVDMCGNASSMTLISILIKANWIFWFQCNGYAAGNHLIDTHSFTKPNSFNHEYVQFKRGLTFQVPVKYDSLITLPCKFHFVLAVFKTTGWPVVHGIGWASKICSWANEIIIGLIKWGIFWVSKWKCWILISVSVYSVNFKW